MSEYIVCVDDLEESYYRCTDIKPETVFGHRLREEIVRCRDCKHMHTVRSWLGMDVDECWLHADPESGALGKEPTEPDGFCAWGERRGK